MRALLIAIMAMVGFAGAACLLAGTAQADGWSGPVPVASQSVVSLSCPSVRFCAAVEFGGDVTTFDGTTWSASSRVDPAAALTAVSCVSATSCVAGDSDGNVLGFDGTRWGAPVLSGGQGPVQSVSCPAIGECDAVTPGSVVGLSGGVWTVIADGYPTDGDPHNHYDYSSISCWAPGACAIVDDAGEVYTIGPGGQLGAVGYVGGQAYPGDTAVSCAPGGVCAIVSSQDTAATLDAGSMSSTVRLGLVEPDTTGPLPRMSVSCVSGSFCVVAGPQGTVAYFLGSASWSSPETAPANFGQVACVSATDCVLAGDINPPASVAYTYAGETRPAPAANIVPPMIPGTPQAGQTVLADPGQWSNGAGYVRYRWELCDGAGDHCQDLGVLTQSSGYIPPAYAGHTFRVTVAAANAGGSAGPVTSAPSAAIHATPGPPVTDPRRLPSRGRVAHNLATRLVPHGTAASVRRLLRRRAYTFSYRPTAACRLTIIWTLRTKSSNRRIRRVTIARRTVTLRAGRSAVVRMALGRTARRVIAASDRPRLMATGVLIESGRTIHASAEIRLQR